MITDDMIKDALRYRWLKEQHSLRLTSSQGCNVWTREDGTKFIASHSLAGSEIQYGSYETLDETIDQAMIVCDNMRRLCLVK